MNSHREVPMLRLSTLVAGLTAVLVTGCDLNVSNPNSPDRNRLDPNGLQQLMSGAFRTWVDARDGYYVMPLTTMADNYTASWNNAAIRFYTSVGVECPVRCGWTNSPTASDAGLVVEHQWYAYYTILSAANDVLRAINNGTCFDTDCATDSTITTRNKTIAKMLEGMAFAGIALIYDQGFAVDENADISNPLALAFQPRAELRDSALSKLDQAYALAGIASWQTESGWAGIGQGKKYTNVQIQQLIRTMQAELVAMYARNAAENATTNWASVVTYASQGVSSGTQFNWEYYIDQSAYDAGIEYVKSWGNSIGTMRVDTRVAHMLDPESQEDPWPDGTTAAKSNPLTRVTAAITGSGSPQVITPLTMPASLLTGRQLAAGCFRVDGSCDGERFIVTATTATTFTAIITQSYPAPTTLTGAVTKDTLDDGSPASVAATPASMTGIAAGDYLWVDDVNNEVVTVDSVNATTFFAKFLKNHAASAVVATPIHRNGGAPGNWCPLTSPDLRVGDGTYGPTDDFIGYATLAQTPNAGTDYACSGVAIFPPARGQYHQSNMQHVRYQALAGSGERLPSSTGLGQDPFYTTQMNDLMWAEALIRSGGNKATAATLINNSRVTRGGLSVLTGAEADTVLLDALHYEQEVEFMGQGATAFFNRRRVDGLLTGTPRQMPVPAKELDVLSRARYTFGGPSNPDMSAGAERTVSSRETVRQRYEEIRGMIATGPLSGWLSAHAHKF